MDDIGIVYLFENAQQFWNEVEDTLRIPPDSSLALLDGTLNRFIQLCASQHEMYLQSPLQLEHACELLLESDLFTWHSERMRDLLLEDAGKNTNPHCQLILYNILIVHGHQHPSFLRAHKKWKPLLPLFMDYVLIDIDADVEDTYTGLTPGMRGSIPIEAKLRSLSVRLLYEVCRSQKLTMPELRIFNNAFIDRLFDLVEETRDKEDDTFNYSLIKLIVALNEQFMVASMPQQHLGKGIPGTNSQAHSLESGSEGKNRVLNILMRRLNLSRTFGENMIFMLNRASNRSIEDRCMQVLVLKLLYLLFTTEGTSEYFYTNDLCVLVDVFLRELLDMDEDSESLRHTFLRVLHPLLTKTQLRTYPYKRPQIVRALESLVEHPEIRDIDPTTKRLVDRCLGGDWCVQFLGANKSAQLSQLQTPTSAVYSDTETPTVSGSSVMRTAAGLTRKPSHKRAPSISGGRKLKNSRSAEGLSASLSRRPSTSTGPHAHALASAASQLTPVQPRALDVVRRGMNDSTSSLPDILSPAPTREAPVTPAGRPGFLAHTKMRSDSTDILETTGGLQSRARSDGTDYFGRPANRDSIVAEPVESASPPPEVKESPKVGQQRRPPPAPPKQRRKPPAVPARRGSGGLSALSQAVPIQSVNV